MAFSPADPVGTDADTCEATVLVTGAASGMGLAVARLFAERGWTVLGVDVDLDGLSAAGDEARVVPLVADVRNRDDLEDLLPATLLDRPQLRAVVNAAGVYPPSSLADYSPELYRRTFDINVLGTLNVTAAAVPHMGHGAAVVNFASIDAFAVSPGQLLYSASKAAVVSLTRSMAIELAGRGISVNAVAPGWVDTPGTREGGRMQQAVQAVPAGRAAAPEEIAEWVWTMVRGSYVTGETLVISGGLIVR